jgi:hypothetical protein
VGVPIRCRWWTLLPAALLGAWLAAPVAARASCGDYVMIGPKPAHGPQHGDRTPPPAPEREAPCHGPSCSGQSLPVAPTPAPVPTGPHGDDWGWPGIALDRADSGPIRRFGPPDSPRPASLPTSVFRPPRIDGRA